MKFGVGLFGVHYIDNLEHWMNWKVNVDYKFTYENNKHFLYNQQDEFLFYSSTYFSNKLQELIQDFNFRILKLKQVNNVKLSVDNNFIRRNQIFKETIKLILEDNIDLDYVILTRYDINFKKKVFDLNIDYDKINLMCKAKWGVVSNLVDDNFYLLKYSKLEEFYNTINSIDEKISSHRYNEYVKDINFLIDGEYFSHEIPTYFIIHKTN